MANRPAWRYDLEKNIIEKTSYEFVFHAGFAVVQKQKNIKALHEQIDGKTLEVSTKSFDEIGIKLSAFNLNLNDIPLENIFQSSKKYENGGPYRDMLNMSPKDAKKDERHQNSGRLVSFVYEKEEFSLEPKTFFYDYIYIISAAQCIASQELKKIMEYDYFTDIEFNPKKSINCQAKSAALLKALLVEYGKLFDVQKERKEFERFYKSIGADRV